MKIIHLKLIVCSLIIIGMFVLGLFIINPKEQYRPNWSAYHLVKTPITYSEHVIAHNCNADEIEFWYRSVRTYFGKQQVNDKVEVYRAKTTGYLILAIRIFPEHNLAWLGVFYPKDLTRKDTIIYNGNPQTLIHELVHFFYEKMTYRERSEALAQLSELAIVQVMQKKLTELYK
jgi:hypothetical protein